MSAYYQTNGKPLSAEALYKQKLKQGVFHSPSGGIVGVNSNASDTAALLAASSDLTVKPSYERTIAPEAHTAALAAKQQRIEIWHRDKEDPYADAAAANARTSTLASTASAPVSSVYTGVPSLNSNSIYTAAQQLSTSTMTSRINPERDIKRSGIQTKSSSASPAAATAALNLHKINQAAERNSTKSLTSRFNPELDYRSGLVGDQQAKTDAGAAATASLKHGGTFTSQVSSQTRSNTFKASDIVGANLLSVASSRANERLNTLNAGTPASLREQAQVYAQALAVAQKNADERIKSHQAGVIDLGGGLTMLRSDLDKLASTYVNPVLQDIEHKADSRRQADLERKQRQLELEQEHERAKQLEAEAKLQEKRDLEAAKQKRIVENEDKKKSEEDKYLEYQKERNDEVDAKGQELRELEAKHAEEKEALLTEKQQNQDRIDEEEANFIAERKKELEDMQAERDELIKPTLEELEVETAKLKELTDARDELDNEVKAAEDLDKEYEDKIAELNAKLEETQAEYEKYTTDLEDAVVKHETTDKELADFQVAHDKDLEDVNNEDKELEEQLAALEKQKEEHLQDKKQKKEAILAGIDEKVKDEHKINNELPEHLRTEVDEDRIRDTGSLFSVEKPKIKEIPLVKEPPQQDDAATPATPEPQQQQPAPPSKKLSVSDVPVIPQGRNKKRLSFSKRLSSIFKKDKHETEGSSSSSASSPATSPIKRRKSSLGSKEGEGVSTSASAPQSGNIPRSTTGTSDFGDYDELSINKKGPHNAVFKEEI
ncbi:EIS1 [[Candida] subhashii]|uniref:EIS1 n=1 Tax=[Candida] subhashii TaxID=561895 RepID=A0A8J5QHJ1_9ASCO|nr:EIS1 [[Candida] subhashii]KAG7664761.1 EIS1 [[Candida] subhashii]